MEEIPNSTHDVPGKGQSKTDAQKGHHGGNAPEYDYHRPVRPVVGLAQLAQVIPPAREDFHAPPNSERKENGLNQHPGSQIHIVFAANESSATAIGAGAEPANIMSEFP